jgi:peptide/nickel transport system substrate-binding protein
MTLHRSRWWRALAALIAITMLLAACGDDDGDAEGPDDTSDVESPDDTTDDTTDDGAAGDPQYGGRVVIGLEAEAGGYTPGLTATGTSSASVDAAIYDPLVAINSEGDFEGFLAESIDVNDDLTEWTITLRSGIQFHDGTPLDAEAIVWNYLNLHRAEGSLTTGAMTTAGLADDDSVEALDDLTVVYRLSRPNAAFPDLLAGRVGMPASPTAFEEMGMDDFGSRPVGTGPFVVQSWTPDDRIVLTRNPDYWLEDENGNQLPYLDEVEFRPLTDEDSRFQSLLADDVQIIQTTRGYAGKRIIDAADDGGFGANAVTGNVAGASIFNISKAPLDDLRVRTAMVMATNSDDIAVAQGYDGITSPATQFTSVDSPWYSSAAADAFPGGEGDIAGATALLEEYINDPDRSDGRSPGDRLSVRYQCPPEPSLQDMAQVLQAVWNDIGIDVELVSVEQPTLIANVIGNADNQLLGEFEVSCWRVGTNEDPLAYVSNYFGPIETTVTNFVNWTDPEIDEQIVILRESADFGERYSALERINIIANENVTTAWHISYSSTIGWRDDLRGVDEYRLATGSLARGNLAGFLPVRSIWIEQ